MLDPDDLREIAQRAHHAECEAALAAAAVEIVDLRLDVQAHVQGRAALLAKIAELEARVERSRDDDHRCPACGKDIDKDSSIENMSDLHYNSQGYACILCPHCGVALAAREEEVCIYWLYVESQARAALAARQAEEG